jgi:hypothetical protein
LEPLKVIIAEKGGRNFLEKCALCLFYKGAEEVAVIASVFLQTVEEL